MKRRLLLCCGVLASLLYTAMNIFIPFSYQGYNWITQTVGELSAIGVSTRPLWVVLGTIYTLLVTVFGWGTLISANRNRVLHITGILITLHGVLGLAWSPMHQREVLAAGGGTFTDVWHIVMSMITLLLMLLSIGFGAFAFGKAFRIFSFITILVFIVFGILIGTEAPNVSRNLPTPFIGLWERINIAAFMVWLLVFALMLLREEKKLSFIGSTKILWEKTNTLNNIFNKTKNT